MSELDQDNDSLMDHCALECMHAIEAKDTDKFMESLHVLVGDLMMKMSKDEES